MFFLYIYIFFTAFSVALFRNHTECPFKHDYPHILNSVQHLKTTHLLNRSYKLKNSFNLFFIFLYNLLFYYQPMVVSVFPYIFIYKHIQQESVFKNCTLYKKVVPVFFLLFCAFYCMFLCSGEGGPIGGERVVLTEVLICCGPDYIWVSCTFSLVWLFITRASGVAVRALGKVRGKEFPMLLLSVHLAPRPGGL